MPKNDSLRAVQLAAQALYDKKGFNILSLDVRDFSTMTDYYLIAEGTVARHITSLAQALLDDLKEEGIDPLRVEGGKGADWIVIDYGFLVVHLMDSEMREKYCLEEMWKKGKIVDLKIKVTKEI